MTGLVALTGATGFIGRHLLADLTARGYRVRVLLRRPVEVPPGAASAVVGDLTRPINMAAALSDVDLAMLTALYQTPDEPEKLQATRLIGNMRRNLEGESRK